MIDQRHTAPLRLRGLGMRYGTGAWALRGVDTTVPAGRTLAVLGPSGCGKSTLLRLVAGLETPGEGEVLLGDRVLSAPGSTVSPEFRDMGMVFQDYALWPHLRVRDIIGYGLRHGVHRTSAGERGSRVAELVGFLRLDGLEDRRPAELSGGQRQRVAIARALATRPRLLLFDEPLSNLDSQLRGEMREELALLLRRLGTTALYVTHDVSEALALADRVLVLHEGRTVQDASPEEVFGRPASGWVADLAGFSSRIEPDAVTVEDGRAVATVGGSRFVGRACGEDVGGGGPAAYLHPEAVRLGEGPGALPAVVVSSVFEGRHHRVRVRVGSAGTVLLHSVSPHRPGDRVGLEIEPDGAVIFGGTAEPHPLGSTRAAQNQVGGPEERHRDALQR
ncbi:ABC transporter ATP-binding protein [Nocardiopsis lambiniae]|uniref:ABC transporter ATP-binding protein n=1 Tax=Nocardiopsis lambiniae TaxID=3075539 RepID=A0ABU2M4M4_9ACTN|nr:ABC transporter ATP-binding protein [Nocardiopsis sp. DSM 44743]MDT0327552.1 ABC transporter ATP-binding protein [Nocardiopsis sp. DSM 44743]